MIAGCEQEYFFLSSSTGLRPTVSLGSSVTVTVGRTIVVFSSGSLVRTEETPAVPLGELAGS